MSVLNTQRHKESRRKRASRHVMKRGRKPHRSNSSPAAKERQMRRKARNKAEKPKLEYSSDEGGQLTSITLIKPEIQ